MRCVCQKNVRYNFNPNPFNGNSFVFARTPKCYVKLPSKLLTSIQSVVKTSFIVTVNQITSGVWRIRCGFWKTRMICYIQARSLSSCNKTSNFVHKKICPINAGSNILFQQGGYLFFKRSDANKEFSEIYIIKILKYLMDNRCMFDGPIFNTLSSTVMLFFLRCS